MKKILCIMKRKAIFIEKDSIEKLEELEETKSKIIFPPLFKLKPAVVVSSFYLYPPKIKQRWPNAAA